VVEAGRELDLAAEAVYAESRAKLGRQDLEHDASAERDLLGHEDAAHPTPAELTLEVVGAAERALQSGEKVGHLPSWQRVVH
jgi:hypothetical protein